MQIDQNIDVLTIVDLSILHFSETKVNHIDSVFEDAGFTDEVIDNKNLERKIYEAIATLENLEYIDNINEDKYRLTELGKQVKYAGGHFAYLKKNAEKSIADTERQRLNDEKLKYDVKNAKRIFKTYWWTFGISILGFLLALGKIIYDIVVAK
jgi:hypothetical protein